MENGLLSVSQIGSNSNSTTILPCDLKHQASEKSVKIKVQTTPSDIKTQIPTPEEIEKHELVALQLQSDEYIRSLQREPPYMRPTSRIPLQQLSLWKYKVTTPEEWSELFAKVEKTVADARCEKRVRVDDTESLACGSMPESLLNSDSTVTKNAKKSILRRIDEAPHEATDNNRFRVATLLERIERGSGIVDAMTRKFTLN